MTKIIFYSTLLSVFSEALYYNVGFDIKFFYIVVFLNFFLLGLANRIKYSNGLLWFHLILILSGVFSIVFGYNTPSYFSIQLFFLLIIPVYYFSFFDFFKFRFDEIIRFYCTCAFWLSVIGLIKLPYDISQGVGLHSLLLEPAHFCTAVLPAFFITYKQRSFKRYMFKIILLAVLLSGSSLGVMGLGIALLLTVKRPSLIKAVGALAVVSILFVITYFKYEPLRLRIDDTFTGITTGDISTLNLSSYALVSNLYVSFQSFLTNPLFGNGVGSHTLSRSMYLGNLKGITVFQDMHIDHLNAQDAGSLFSRVMSELGMIGLIGIFIFIRKFYVSNISVEQEKYSIVSRGIILYFSCKLIREGHYFSPEMYFFVFAYVYNKWMSNISLINNEKNYSNICS